MPKMDSAEFSEDICEGGQGGDPQQGGREGRFSQFSRPALSMGPGGSKKPHPQRRGGKGLPYHLSLSDTPGEKREEYFQLGRRKKRTLISLYGREVEGLSGGDYVLSKKNLFKDRKVPNS